MAAAALDTFRCVVSLECSGEAEDEQPVTPNTSTLKKFYFNHNILNVCDLPPFIYEMNHILMRHHSHSASVTTGRSVTVNSS